MSVLLGFENLGSIRWQNAAARRFLHYPTSLTGLDLTFIAFRLGYLRRQVRMAALFIL